VASRRNTRCRTCCIGRFHTSKPGKKELETIP
jgi:hypothetical protein